MIWMDALREEHGGLLTWVQPEELEMWIEYADREIQTSEQQIQNLTRQLERPRRWWQDLFGSKRREIHRDIRFYREYIWSNRYCQEQITNAMPLAREHQAKREQHLDLRQVLLDAERQFWEDQGMERTATSWQEDRFLVGRRQGEN